MKNLYYEKSSLLAVICCGPDWLLHGLGGPAMLICLEYCWIYGTGFSLMRDFLATFQASFEYLSYHCYLLCHSFSANLVSYFT